MKEKLILVFLFILAVFMLNNVGAEQVCETYDDFSSGTLDLEKWEIRQDVEGQPLMDEYEVLEENGGFVFHTQQNIVADRRVYLFPTRQFTTGDSIEYDVNLISRSGNYAQMTLLTGDQYIRIGMRGNDAGFDELGVAHMNLVFEENNLHIERETPSGNLLIDNLNLFNSNGNYELYIGSFSGHNGIVHMDYDNFIICGDEEEPNLEERVAELEQRVEELESRNSAVEQLLNSFINTIVEFIEGLPQGLRNHWNGF